MKTKIYAIWFVLVLVSTSSFSQSALDSKYGIGKLKLGSDYSLYKSDLTYEGKTNSNFIIYRYTGLELKTYLGFKTHKVLLVFWNNKLFEIQVFILFDAEPNGFEFNRKNYEETVRKISEVYGQGEVNYFSNKVDKFNGNEIIKSTESTYWSGKRCVLVADNFYFPDTRKEKFDQGVQSAHLFVIYITSKELEKQKLESEL